MHRLYEKFVLGYYVREYPVLSASASYINWNLEDGADKLHLPVMKSDVTLTKGNKTIIIDTKYYGRTMQHNSLYNSTSIISSNLYQIYTYVKNKDVKNTGNVMGVLLYAKTDEEITPDNDYVIGGNQISVKTLDLSGIWEEIKAQLDNIVLYFIK
jgi:5-methylcytosine-specific restriction enzyme subunit McrC